MQAGTLKGNPKLSHDAGITFDRDMSPWDTPLQSQYCGRVSPSVSLALYAGWPKPASESARLAEQRAEVFKGRLFAAKSERTCYYFIIVTSNIPSSTTKNLKDISQKITELLAFPWERS